MSSLRLESRQYKAKGIVMITDKIEMTIPGELPDLNTIIAESKKGNRNWQPYNHMKKEHTEKIAWIAKSKRVKFEKVDVEITWICKDKRRDKDNIMAGTKFILDGLVLASVIKNDGWSQIGTINHAFEVDKNNPRIEITLHEAKAR